MASETRRSFAGGLIGSRPLTTSVALMYIGIAITLVFVIAAIFAPMFQGWGWLQNPNDGLANAPHLAPSAEHWFGTSRQGYDVFSRTVFGARAAWQVVLVATAMSVVVGRGVVNAAIALSIAYVPQYYRVVRNHTVSVKNELFIEAAQSMGASTWAVLSRYLFLNVVQSVPVLFTLNAADAVLILGGLGFLGLGLPEATPEWGDSLRQALDVLPTGDVWWTALFPGLAITLMVTGLSLIGEGLNEFINPLLRRENWD